MPLDDVEVQRIWWKEYYEDLYNIYTQEQVAVYMCGFIGEPIRGCVVAIRVGKLKNGKAVGKDEAMGEMIKGGGDMVVDWHGGCVIWCLRVVLYGRLEICCTRVKERARIVAIIKVLV